jgi:aspartokinase/homoserine dehydrogenase 1
MYLPMPSRIDLVLIGARGQVGSALRTQLGRQLSRWRDQVGLDLKLIAAFDRRGFAFDLQGLAPDDLDARLHPRQDGDADRLLDHVTRVGAPRTVVIDCTASETVADCYSRLLTGGVGVVGANKHANSRCLASYRGLQQSAHDNRAPYRYETTVGAAIPLLAPLRDLRLRGEPVLSIRGVLSGSLSYILHRLHEGCAFSAAVAEARALGYTEPDPLEDLSANDLGRKLLVLAREAGFALEPADLRIEPLSRAESVAGRDLAEVLAGEDAGWQQKISSALARGERWIVLAEVDAHGGRVGLHCVDAQSSFARLQPGQNLIEIRTGLQDPTPLVVSGPGAGAQITAAGVLSDVLGAATQLAARH